MKKTLLAVCTTLIIILVWLGRVEGFQDLIIRDLTMFDGRKPGTLAHYQSYIYLLNQVKKLPVTELEWAPNFTQKFSHMGVNHQNIIFCVGKPSEKHILIMAHYDHLGPGFPGGNDNASGVYALLLIASSISQSTWWGFKKYPKCQIIFALTDGEETDKMGSWIIKKRLPSDNVVINVDTIGGFPDDQPISVANNGNYTKFFMRYAWENNINIRLIDIQRDRSDMHHFISDNICVEFGAPIGEYHTSTDTYGRINKKNMFKIIWMVLAFIEHLCY